MQVKQSSLRSRQTPKQLLAAMKLNTLIEQYMLSRQKHLINLSAASVSLYLPPKQYNTLTEDIEFDVPYTESLQYISMDDQSIVESETIIEKAQNSARNHGINSSSRTSEFPEKQQPNNEAKLQIQKAFIKKTKQQQLEDQNFTDQQESESHQEVSEIKSRRKLFESDTDSEDGDDDYEFVTHEPVRNKMQSRSTLVNSGAIVSEVSQLCPSSYFVHSNRQDDELQGLRETAYFKLQQHPKIDKKTDTSPQLLPQLTNQKENSNKNNQRTSPALQKQTLKATILSKIQTAKTRKQIADSLHKQKTFLTKYLK